VLAGADDRPGARRRVEAALAGGRGVETAQAWVQAQGGDPRAVEEPWSVLEAAPVRLDVPAPRTGTVERADALAIGLAAVQLGAGRARKGDPVDHAVGIVMRRKPGEPVEAGAPVATVHARDAATARRTAAAVAVAVDVADRPVLQPSLLIDTIR
jgi:thymidine phosphorylase